MEVETAVVAREKVEGEEAEASVVVLVEVRTEEVTDTSTT